MLGIPVECMSQHKSTIPGSSVSAHSSRTLPSITAAASVRLAAAAAPEGSSMTARNTA